MFYTILWLILWSLSSFPAITAFNGPLVSLLIALVADLLVRGTWLKAKFAI